MKIAQRRPILLLEVMIAFVLVTLCALPLIYPHVAIYKAEREFLFTVELDQAVNLVFANRLEKLYLHEISWEEVSSGKTFPIDDSLLAASGVSKALPFTGVYKFERIRYKPEKQPEDAVYLYKIIFEFLPKVKKEGQKPLTYEYQFVIERRPDEKS